MNIIIDPVFGRLYAKDSRGHAKEIPRIDEPGEEAYWTLTNDETMAAFKDAKA